MGVRVRAGALGSAGLPLHSSSAQVRLATIGKRLQVVMDDEGSTDIEAIAKRSGESVSGLGWAPPGSPAPTAAGEAGRKLASLRAALYTSFRPATSNKSWRPRPDTIR